MLLTAGELVARVEAALRPGGDDRALRRRVLDVLARAVPFDAFAWPLTDPVTTVGTSPLADVPCLDELPELIRLRYVAAPRWTAGNGTRSLVRDGSPQLRGFLARYGVQDVASTAFRDRHGTWAFLDLWRAGPFTPAELRLLDAIRPAVTTALRRAAAESFRLLPAAADVGHAGPAVLLLGPDLRVRDATAESDALLRAVLPTESDRVPVPAGAYNVAAQLVALEQGLDGHPPAAATPTGSGWVGFRAGRLSGRTGDVAVTIEPLAPDERLVRFARAHGLTPRETEVLRCLADGDDARTVGRRLGLSDHTVQDHLKALANRTGLHTRGALLSAAFRGS